MSRLWPSMLWTSYQEIAEFARNRAAALDTVILIRRVEGGWILPYCRATWNGLPNDLGDAEYYERRREHLADVAAAFPEGRDEPTYGLSPISGETLMEGYEQFSDGEIEE